MAYLPYVQRALDEFRSETGLEYPYMGNDEQQLSFLNKCIDYRVYEIPTGYILGTEAAEMLGISYRTFKQYRNARSYKQDLAKQLRKVHGMQVVTSFGTDMYVNRLVVNEAQILAIKDAYVKVNYGSNN